MSDLLRVGFVAEGPTDFVALNAAVSALLGDVDFTPTLISPLVDQSLAAQTGGGWAKVYLWCRQMLADAGGDARKSDIFTKHEILVIQVDADVADKKYTDDQRITNPPQDLPIDLPCDKPCKTPCPRPREITDALRSVVLGWLGEAAMPPKTVVCIPSRSIETWVLVALFPDDPTAVRPNIECRRDCEVRLKTHGLIKSGKKLIKEYRANENAIAGAWGTVRRRCGEAERFSQEFLALVPAI
jgi:hypothetical protein